MIIWLTTKVSFASKVWLALEILFAPEVFLLVVFARFLWEPVLTHWGGLSLGVLRHVLGTILRNGRCACIGALFVFADRKPATLLLL